MRVAGNVLAVTRSKERRSMAFLAMTYDLHVLVRLPTVRHCPHDSRRVVAVYAFVHGHSYLPPPWVEGANRMEGPPDVRLVARLVKTDSDELAQVGQGLVHRYFGDALDRYRLAPIVPE